jgi:hypothetical protein
LVSVTIIINKAQPSILTEPKQEVTGPPQFKNTGGTILHPNKKLMCLSGTGANATAFEVN